MKLSLGGRNPEPSPGLSQFVEATPSALDKLDELVEVKKKFDDGELYLR